MGRCTFAKENIDNKSIIDIRELNPGIYFVKIKKDNQNHSIIKIAKI